MSTLQWKPFKFIFIVKCTIFVICQIDQSERHGKHRKSVIHVITHCGKMQVDFGKIRIINNEFDYGLIANQLRRYI